MTIFHNTFRGISRVFQLISQKNIIGIIACFCIFMSGVIFNGNIGVYFNISALLIVLGGTFCTTLICFRFNRLRIVWNVLTNSYQPASKTSDEIIEILVDLSVKSKYHGLYTLEEDEEESSLGFLKQALGYLVDGYTLSEIRESLSSEMFFFKKRREDSEQVLTTMADICHSFGLVGSVVGLISMVSGIGQTTVIMTTIPVALVSTLYGIIFSYFFFLPFAANIKEKTDQELLLQKIILEGTIAIGNQSHPSILERKVKSFLTPSARGKKIASLERIRTVIEKTNETHNTMRIVP